MTRQPRKSVTRTWNILKSETDYAKAKNAQQTISPFVVKKFYFLLSLGIKYFLIAVAMPAVAIMPTSV